MKNSRLADLRYPTEGSHRSIPFLKRKWPRDWLLKAMTVFQRDRLTRFRVILMGAKSNLLFARCSQLRG